jgi:acetoin utilization deacetylase AcuC-like enzyme
MLRAFTAIACLWHRPGSGFPERFERLEGILAALRDRSWEFEEVDGHEGARAAIEAVHAPGYLERFERAVARGDGFFDSSDNPIDAGSFAAAWGAVEATLAAVDWVVEGTQRIGFAAVRPPGHHAERDLAMGFCFFANAAIAAQYLRDHHGFERPAIYDFDVHHGNGTQHLLEARPDMLYVSTHQFPFYPGSGAVSERGVGAGLGATVNLPLAARSDDAAFERVVEEGVLPALAAFGPDVLILSAGFDAFEQDPLGGLALTREGFARLGQRLGRFAAEACAGRVVVVLEGGYALGALAGLVTAHLEGLEEGLMAAAEAQIDFRR